MNTTKYLSIVIMCIASQLAFGQIRVDSLGHVGIGTGPTASLPSLFNVGGSGSPVYTSSFRSISNKKGLYISNASWANNEGIGIYILNKTNANNPIRGINIDTNTGGAITNQGVFGVKSVGRGSSSKNIGVYGGIGNLIVQGEDSTYFSAGIFGSSNESVTYKRYGNYAGYFHGDVCVDGISYLYNITPVNRNNTMTFVPLTDVKNGERVTELLMSLVPLQTHDNSDGIPDQVSKTDIKLTKELGYDLPTEVMPVQTKKHPVGYSIETETLQKVFPELVYEDKDGNVSINYTEMIPLLLQSIKELKAEIDELKRQLKGK